jgi:putative ABC transport system permease protein
MKVLSRQGMRRGLIIVQFVIALVFIVSTVTVKEQFNRFLNVDHLFDMSNNIVVELNKTSAEQLKAELLRNPTVENVSAASFVPAGFINSWARYKNAGGDSEWADVRYFAVDEDYARNLGLSMVAGQFFAHETGASNRKFVVINEQAAKLFGYPTSLGAVGQVIVDQRDSSDLQVIGVVKDYHSTLVTSPIQPTILAYLPEQFNILQVKYSGANAEAEAAIEAAWKKVNPGRKPAYAPLSDEVFKFYNLIFKDLLKILGTVSFFSILICCLGLLGIVHYSMETRVKEVSIRKICGASAASLIGLLSKSYVWLFVFAILIGLPLAFLINQFWLENLSNHINLGIGILSASVLMLALLTGGTILSQTIGAIRVKPVDTLKME